MSSPSALCAAQTAQLFYKHSDGHTSLVRTQLGDSRRRPLQPAAHHHRCLDFQHKHERHPSNLSFTCGPCSALAASIRAALSNRRRSANGSASGPQADSRRLIGQTRVNRSLLLDITSPEGRTASSLVDSLKRPSAQSASVTPLGLRVLHSASACFT